MQRDATIQQRHRDAIGEAVIGRFARRRMPLLRIAPDNFDCDIVTADFNLAQALDFIGPLRLDHLRSQGQRRFDRSLGMVFHREMFDVGIENLERSQGVVGSPLSTQSRQLEWSGHQLHEALFAFKDGGGACHASLGQDGREQAVACGI